MTKAGLLRLEDFARQRHWVSRGIAIFAVALMGVGASQAADVAIGSLQLYYSNGNQQLSFYNFTGPTYGCDGVEYEVCNGINIDSWAITMTFTGEGDTDPLTDTYTSPLTFSSTGPGDVIAPYNGAPTGFTGGASGTWQIPLNYGDAGEPACPPCDYELTQVEFSGTIDAADLPLTVGSPGSNATFNAQPTFDFIWTVPASDYVLPLGPAYIGDGIDVLVSDQPSSSPSTPEPASLLLVSGGLLAAVLLKRLHSKHHFGCVGGN